MTVFPSDDDRLRLVGVGAGGVRVGPLSALGPDDRRRWHAYDYGWRRAMLGERGDRSPADPEQFWYDPGLAAAAERYWRARFGKPAPGREQGRARVETPPAPPRRHWSEAADG